MPPLRERLSSDCSSSNPIETSDVLRTREYAQSRLLERSPLHNASLVNSMRASPRASRDYVDEAVAPPLDPRQLYRMRDNKSKFRRHNPVA